MFEKILFFLFRYRFCLVPLLIAVKYRSLNCSCHFGTGKKKKLFLSPRWTFTQFYNARLDNTKPVNPSKGELPFLLLILHALLFSHSILNSKYSRVSLIKISWRGNNSLFLLEMHLWQYQEITVCHLQILSFLLNSCIWLLWQFNSFSDIHTARCSLLNILFCGYPVVQCYHQMLWLCFCFLCQC